MARYRQTTLQAIGEVEDALVQLNVLAEEIVVQREALAASQDTLRLTETNIKPEWWIILQSPVHKPSH